jgi:hypothetical protein
MNEFNCGRLLLETRETFEYRDIRGRLKGGIVIDSLKLELLPIGRLFVGVLVKPGSNFRPPLCFASGAMLGISSANNELESEALLSEKSDSFNV